MLKLSLYVIVSITVVQSLWCWNSVEAWDNAEFEMFDLVEEIGVGNNFYDILGVPQDAEDKAIRSAYRKMSVKLHPDKNPAEDAATKFRQLVGIYEVLKNKELRESYNRVLVEGLPNWRHPMFYFRRARKLALWQVTVIVLGIVSLGQYLAGWASYFEKRLSMKEIIEARLKKTGRTKKGQKEGPSAAELEAEFEEHLPKPSLWNLAPFQLLRLTKYLIIQFPFDALAFWRQYQEEKQQAEELARQEQEELEQERLKKLEPKKPKKRKTFNAPERNEDEDVRTQPVWSGAGAEPVRKEVKKAPVVTGGLWTDEDLNELARLSKKYPGGTLNRWEVVAEALNRPVVEVTFMAKKVLERLATKPEETAQEVPKPVKVKSKTKGASKAEVLASVSADARNVENWTPEEQKALEQALQTYPKSAIERWEKIARMVPSRSKEECMLRYKYVADMVKKKKEAQKPVDDQQPSEEPAVVKSEAAETSVPATATEEVIQQPSEVPVAQGKEPSRATSDKEVLLKSKKAKKKARKEQEEEELEQELREIASKENDTLPPLPQSDLHSELADAMTEHDLFQKPALRRKGSSSENSDDWCLLESDSVVQD